MDNNKFTIEITNEIKLAFLSLVTYGRLNTALEVLDQKKKKKKKYEDQYRPTQKKKNKKNEYQYSANSKKKKKKKKKREYRHLFWYQLISILHSVLTLSWMYEIKVE